MVVDFLMPRCLSESTINALKHQEQLENEIDEIVRRYEERLQEWDKEEKEFREMGKHLIEHFREMGSSDLIFPKEISTKSPENEKVGKSFGVQHSLSILGDTTSGLLTGNDFGETNYPASERSKTLIEGSNLRFSSPCDSDTYLSSEHTGYTSSLYYTTPGSHRRSQTSDNTDIDTTTNDDVFVPHSMSKSPEVKKTFKSMRQTKKIFEISPIVNYDSTLGSKVPLVMYEDTNTLTSYDDLAHSTKISRFLDFENSDLSTNCKSAANEKSNTIRNLVPYDVTSTDLEEQEEEVKPLVDYDLTLNNTVDSGKSPVLVNYDLTINDQSSIYTEKFSALSEHTNDDVDVSRASSIYNSPLNAKLLSKSKEEDRTLKRSIVSSIDEHFAFENPNDTAINEVRVKKVYEQYLDEELDYINHNETGLTHSARNRNKKIFLAGPKAKREKKNGSSLEQNDELANKIEKEESLVDSFTDFEMKPLTSDIQTVATNVGDMSESITEQTSMAVIFSPLKKTITLKDPQLQSPCQNENQQLGQPSPMKLEKLLSVKEECLPISSSPTCHCDTASEVSVQSIEKNDITLQGKFTVPVQSSSVTATTSSRNLYENSFSKSTKESPNVSKRSLTIEDTEKSTLKKSSTVKTAKGNNATKTKGTRKRRKNPPLIMPKSFNPNNLNNQIYTFKSYSKARAYQGPNSSINRKLRQFKNLDTSSHRSSAIYSSKKNKTPGSVVVNLTKKKATSTINENNPGDNGVINRSFSSLDKTVTNVSKDLMQKFNENGGSQAGTSSAHHITLTSSSPNGSVECASCTAEIDSSKFSLSPQTPLNQILCHSCICVIRDRDKTMLERAANANIRAGHNLTKRRKKNEKKLLKTTFMELMNARHKNTQKQIETDLTNVDTVNQNTVYDSKSDAKPTRTKKTKSKAKKQQPEKPLVEQKENNPVTNKNLKKQQNEDQQEEMRTGAEALSTDHINVDRPTLRKRKVVNYKLSPLLRKLTKSPATSTTDGDDNNIKSEANEQQTDRKTGRKTSTANKVNAPDQNQKSTSKTKNTSEPNAEMKPQRNTRQKSKNTEKTNPKQDSINSDRKHVTFDACLSTVNENSSGETKSDTLSTSSVSLSITTRILRKRKAAKTTVDENDTSPDTSSDTSNLENTVIANNSMTKESRRKGSTPTNIAENDGFERPMPINHKKNNDELQNSTLENSQPVRETSSMMRRHKKLFRSKCNGLQTPPSKEKEPFLNSTVDSRCNGTGRGLAAPDLSAIQNVSHARTTSLRDSKISQASSVALNATYGMPENLKLFLNKLGK